MNLRESIGRAVVLSAVLIVTTSAAALWAVSNTAFKFIKPIAFKTSKGGQGNNWTALPYNNSYGTAQGLCDKTGLIASGSYAASIGIRDPVTRALTRVIC